MSPGQGVPMKATYRTELSQYIKHAQPHHRLSHCPIPPPNTHSDTDIRHAPPGRGKPCVPLSLFPSSLSHPSHLFYRQTKTHKKRALPRTQAPCTAAFQWKNAERNFLTPAKWPSKRPCGQKWQTRIEDNTIKVAAEALTAPDCGKTNSRMKPTSGAHVRITFSSFFFFSLPSALRYMRSKLLTCCTLSALEASVRLLHWGGQAHLQLPNQCWNVQWKSFWHRCFMTAKDVISVLFYKLAEGHVWFIPELLILCFGTRGEKSPALLLSCIGK